MQVESKKILKLAALTLGLIFVAPLAKGQAQQSLAKADSLFSKQQYMQALEEYEMIFEEQTVYSPQMLLKMAYVCEASGDYTRALYFLSLYYKRGADFEALAQMAELADRHDLEGYRYTDYEYLAVFFERYYAELLYGGFGALGLVVGLLFVLKFRQKDVRPAAIALSVVIGLFYWTVNFGFEARYGIVAENEVHLMGAPSAGAEVVRVLEKGHRLRVVGEEDIWAEAVWEGGAEPQTVYVRKSRLLMVR